MVKGTRRIMFNRLIKVNFFDCCCSEVLLPPGFGRFCLDWVDCLDRLDCLDFAQILPRSLFGVRVLFISRRRLCFMTRRRSLIFVTGSYLIYLSQVFSCQTRDGNRIEIGTGHEYKRSAPRHKTQTAPRNKGNSDPEKRSKPIQANPSQSKPIQANLPKHGGALHKHTCRDDLEGIIFFGIVTMQSIDRYCRLIMFTITLSTFSRLITLSIYQLINYAYFCILLHSPLCTKKQVRCRVHTDWNTFYSEKNAQCKQRKSKNKRKLVHN